MMWEACRWRLVQKGGTRAADVWRYDDGTYGAVLLTPAGVDARRIKSPALTMVLAFVEQAVAAGHFPACPTCPDCTEIHLKHRCDPPADVPAVVGG